MHCEWDNLTKTCTKQQILPIAQDTICYINTCVYTYLCTHACLCIYYYDQYSTNMKLRSPNNWIWPAWNTLKNSPFSNGQLLAQQQWLRLSKNVEKRSKSAVNAHKTQKRKLLRTTTVETGERIERRPLFRLLHSPLLRRCVKNKNIENNSNKRRNQWCRQECNDRTDVRYIDKPLSWDATTGVAHKHP